MLVVVSELNTNLSNVKHLNIVLTNTYIVISWPIVSMVKKALDSRQ